MTNELSISEKIRESIQYIRSKTDTVPTNAIILGSGLGNFADTIQNSVRIPTSEIPFFPQSTVEGHKGFLVFGERNGLSILALQGRTHYYEGHSIQDVAYVVRIMSELGVKTLLVTNAAGGVNPRFAPGDLMIIVDHINFLFKNPLSGAVVPPEPRWTDMNNCYEPDIIKIIEQAGVELGIPLKKGVLFVSSGPTYETAAEVQMVSRFGGDAVSMSTVPEVLIARSRGIRVGGISCITNLATGISKTPLSHHEVTEIAEQVKDKFQRLVGLVLVRLGKA